MKYLLFLFFLIFVGCSLNKPRSNFDFSNDMSFNEFKIKLNEYSQNNPYPKIDD
jgi:hypothetical protein